MAWAGAGLESGSGRVVRIEGGSGRFEAISQDLVETEIASEDETIGGVGNDAMGVRTGLALRVDTGAMVLNERARGGEAFGIDRQRRDAAAAIIRHQHALAGVVDDQVTR